MKKIIISFIFLLIITVIFLGIILSTIGFETDKFNNLISNKLVQAKKINVNLEKIKFKFEPKTLSLFLETQNPELVYKNVFIPVKNIRVYIDFLSLLKSNPKVNKVNLFFDELNIVQLNKLSTIIKPSSFKSLLKNKIKEGKLISEIEIYLSEEGLIKNFIAKGKVKNLKVKILNNINLSNISFNFFADKNDILIKNIYGNLQNVKISEGDIKLNLDDGIRIDSNFKSALDLDKKFINQLTDFFDKNSSLNLINYFKGKLNNYLFLELDKTYKVINYIYSVSGNLKEAKIELHQPIKNSFISNEIKEIYISDLQLKTKYESNILKFNGEGKYSLNNSDFLPVKFESNFNNELKKINLNFDYKDSLKIDFINYKKTKNSIANFTINFEENKNKNKIKIKNFIFNDGKDTIKLEDFEFKNKKFLNFKNLNIITSNNNFFIENRKKIFIKGSRFDATNFNKFINNQNDKNIFEDINSAIEIDFKNVEVPMSEKFENFKLIGEIKQGQFIKITSKGDYGGNNYLDISLKKDEKNNKKYLEVYSDLTRPLLTEYSFFDGLSGGKLLFTSIIDKTSSSSKLKIENFKVINAPGVIKLLSLADLGGLADLAEGEGLSFDLLEIKMEKNKDFLKFNEILALGPSISVLMEGYQDENNLTSLRGTLVPAKTLNTMISKIPVIGDIVIPKDVGEGLFGISFKMKGPKGKIKTTINPIRTLTPRFLQKIIERKNSK